MSRNRGAKVRKTTRENVYVRDDFTCHYCGCRPPRLVGIAEVTLAGFGNHLTVDHIIPKSEGGRNSLYNLVTCCFLCNNTRGSKEYIEFYLEMKEKIHNDI